MNTQASPADSFRIGLSPEHLNAAFPFHLALDSGLSIVQCGSSLLRTCPDAMPGAMLPELFLLKRPELFLNFNALCSMTTVVTLWEHRRSGMLFRGQIIPEAGGQSLLLLWSPWLSDNSDLGRFDLSLNDFALHDPVVDLLQVLQSQKIAFEDLRALTERLSKQRSELRAANEELNRQFQLLAEAKELLQRQEEETRKLALIASHTDNAVVLTNREGRVEWINEAFTRITGYTLPEFLGKRPGTILQGPGTDLATVAYMSQQIEKQESFTAEVLNYKKSGEAYWIHIEVQPIRDETGEVTNFMAIERDVTLHRENQFALLKAKREADSANQAKSEFLAAMSHEIRSPMTAVLGTLELLRSSKLDGEQELWIRTAYESANALLKIIDDILDFSKIEAGKLVLNEVSFDLEALLIDIQRLFLPRSEAAGLDLRLVLDTAMPRRRRGDPFRLRQVLVNLIGNALKFTDAGEVEISVYPVAEGDPGLLGFRVRDTGIGIPEDSVRNLFQEFVQLQDGNQRRQGGTGLGLAICKRLVELMGGEVGVESHQGIGSTFWFSARFEIDSAPAQAATELNGDVAAPAPPEFRGRILLAEDGEAIRLVISTLLTQSGYSVHAVSNGAAAVEAVREGHFDLVLMDGQMPIMNGSEATRAIRALPDARSRLPILALTANALLENRNACLAAGMDDFITKPVEKGRLLACINHWLGRQTNPSSFSEVRSLSSEPAPVLDEELLQQLVDNTDETTMREAVQLFFEDAAQRIERIGHAAATNDLDLLRLESHTIKGGAALVGASRLSEAAECLEAACRRDDRQRVPGLAEAVGVTFKASRLAYRDSGFLA